MLNLKVKGLGYGFVYDDTYPNLKNDCIVAVNAIHHLLCVEYGREKADDIFSRVASDYAVTRMFQHCGNSTGLLKRQSRNKNQQRQVK